MVYIVAGSCFKGMACYQTCRDGWQTRSETLERSSHSSVSNVSLITSITIGGKICLLYSHDMEHVQPALSYSVLQAENVSV